MQNAPSLFDANEFNKITFEKFKLQGSRQNTLIPAENWLERLVLGFVENCNLSHICWQYFASGFMEDKATQTFLEWKFLTDI